MPTDCARNNKKASDEFESVNIAMITRKPLKLPSKPRNESFTGKAGAASF
jgi:hypothetical protein